MMSTSHANWTGEQMRLACRSGKWNKPTAGCAMGFVQANLVMVFESAAKEFRRFCELNPKPCPILEITEPGRFEAITVAPGSDLRTDLPRFRVLSKGKCAERPLDVVSYCARAAQHNAQMVGFLLGCSFTFENALLHAGIPVRHIEEGKNVPMYRTNLSCHAAGPFAGPLVASMRPMTAKQARIAEEITAKTPLAHGGPIHVGDPAAIGIADLNHPDYGDAVTIANEELPVFWACGVTPLEVLTRAKLDLAITHEPGHMFVTDLKDDDLQSTEWCSQGLRT